MIYLSCVVRGQLVFGFKDEHKSEQDFKIKINITCTDTEMQFQWAMQNISQLFLEHEWDIDSEAMRVRGKIVLVKSN